MYEINIGVYVYKYGLRYLNLVVTICTTAVTFTSSAFCPQSMCMVYAPFRTEGQSYRRLKVYFMGY
jgi:hypothetical protein